jgi:NDP-sugar pyrophosphorylase family protein
LAGGLATRLRPVTETIPKALVEVAGEPFLFHQLRLLRDHGVSKAIVCVGHLGELVEARLQDWTDPDISVELCFDGPELRGTAGALRHALPQLGDTFFVLYGDSYLLCDFARVQQAFARSGKAALMTVFKNLDRWERSNVEFADGQIHRYDKHARTSQMHHVDYGLGILTRRALMEVRDNQPADLAVLYQQLLARGDLAGLEVSERFYEIGSFEGLAETRQLLASGSLGSGVRT